jgi:integrase
MTPGYLCRAYGRGQRQSRRPTESRDKAIVLTLLDSGLRAGELCALTLV